MGRILRRKSCVGMAALVALLISHPSVNAGGKVHEVQQVEFTFEPAEITVAPGDVVRWIWNDCFHTVTSGVECLPDGLFNEPLDPKNPIVEFEIPLDMDGEIPYYCEPHCDFGMVGRIVVELDPGCKGDVDGSGAVDFGDILAILSAWGPCEGTCPEDLDKSGDVGFSDLLIVLASWGPCP